MNAHAGQLPPLRPGRKAKAQNAKPLTQAAVAQRRPGRRVLLMAGVAVMLVVAALAMAMQAADPPQASAPTVDTDPVLTAVVPRLAVAQAPVAQDLLLPGHRIEANRDDDGCHLLAGRKAALTHSHVVYTDTGSVVTAAAPLLCVDGTDYGLTVLLDCAPKRICALISLFSTRTQTYYAVPPEAVSLIHRAGQPVDHFPTHLVVRKPMRLRAYGGYIQ